MVGLFLRQHAAGESLTIVPDGTQRRDFTHVHDVVNANILAMLTDDHDHFGEVFNVGTGTNHSVLELAAMISDETILVEPRLGEAYITLANIEKIKKVFGWMPMKKLEDYVAKQLKTQ